LKTEIAVSDIDIEHPIYYTAKTLIVKYKPVSEETEYILKATGFNQPTPERISILKHEFDIINSIQNENVIKTLGLVKIENGLGILLEDFKGGDLLQFSILHPHDIKVLLEVFISSVKGLQAIHKSGVIHKDIKPQNILVNEKGSSLRIIDFDISTKTKKENFSGDEVLTLAGTLGYLSPEQTGRMNRSLDYRTDYYSLGATFYEAFCIEKVFVESENKMEMIHAHIAKMPTPPKQRNPKIPLALSNIILKLLEKNAEDRYQSSIGILHDLNKCRNLLLEKDDFDFKLGEKDLPEHFRIPEKMYGREMEVESIIKVFSEINKKSQFLLISGVSGSGKSYLVNEIQKPLSKEKGFFLTGKCEQFKKDIPYFALISALEQFTNAILTYSEQGIDYWKKIIIDAVGDSLSVLNHIIPDFSLIFGTLPPMEELPPLEAQNRFNRVLLNFLHIFSKNDIPVVFFFDDLQWADSSFLTLLHNIVVELNFKNVLVIGSYRDNEVNETDTLSVILNEIEKETEIHRIVLASLNEESIGNILQDSLNRSQEEVQELIPIIYQKTRGNAFFVVQFLEHLYKENVLFLDEKISAWNWDLDKLKTQFISNNVIELLTKQLKELDLEVSNIIQYCSCIGNVFSLKEISVLLEMSERKVAELLEVPIREGYLIPLNKNYLYATKNDQNSAVDVLYKFNHDRIQEAAYTLLSPQERKSLHLKIGKNLLRNYEENHLPDDEVFKITNHLNQARELIETREDLSKLKNLNFIAGKKSNSSAAFAISNNFFTIARDIALELKETDTEDFFSITIESAEAQYLCEQYEAALELLEDLEREFLDDDKFIKICIIKARLFTKWNKLSEVEHLFIYGMNRIGISVPSSKIGILFNFVIKLIKCKLQLSTKNLDFIRNLSINHDAKGTLLLSFYMETTSAIFIHNQYLYLLSSLNMFLYLLREGNLPGACFPYSSYGVILTALKDYKKAYEFGNLALEISNFFPERKLDYWRMKYIFHQFLVDWVDKIRDTTSSMEGLEQKLYENGDPTYAGYSIAARTTKYIFLSHNILEILEANEKHLNYFKVSKNNHCYSLFITTIQGLKCLAGKTKDYNSFSTEDFNEEEDLKIRMNEPPVPRGYYSCYKLFALYHMSFYEEAGSLAIESIQFIPAFLSMLMEVELSFYICASLLASKQAKTKKYRKAISKLISAFQKYSKTQNDNFNHLYLFLCAEKEYSEKNFAKAFDLYQKSISECNKGGYSLLEAKVNERLGDLEEKRGNAKLALYFFSESYTLYDSLGAKGKTNLLLEEKPGLKKQFLKNFNARNVTEMQMTHTIHSNTSLESMTSISGNQQLDYETIIKSSQKLSAEIDLKSLLSQLLDILITNAGATKGIYYSVENNRYTQEITRSTKENYNTEAPLSVLQNVLNKKRELVVNNTNTDSVFSKDPYIRQYKPLSLLCTPIMKQKEVRGLLYLENDLTTDAFTKERLELLSTLATQAAISIENARLFDRMQKLNEANEKFVPTPLLSILQKQSITELKLGDQTQREMTVLFSDIRSFTSLSESMSPQENFNFINSYLSRMGPHVRQNHGFIDKYIGDAVMALFPRLPEDAIQAGIDMQKELITYNQHRSKQGFSPISIGIGVHTGNLMLGIIGESERMEGTVISDTVNLASRLEGLTKMYGISLMISEDTLLKVDRIENYKYRLLDNVIVKGKQNSIRVYQVFEGLSSEEEDLLQATKLSFELGIEAYQGRRFTEALDLFQNVAKLHPEDVPTQIYLKRCNKAITEGVSDDWTGIEKMTEK